MHGEWETSAHAAADEAPAYRAMRRAARDEGCGDDCHAPLRKLAPQSAASAEAITCDVCHTVRAVDIGDDRSRLSLGIDDMIRYGPLCDAKNHYFHRMGCSPLHRSAELCAGCHHWIRDKLPVFTTYLEWKQGPYPAENKICQACHMPGSRAEVATGSGVRDGVPDHSLMGEGGKLRLRAAALAVAAQDRDGKLAITAEVTNVGSGHDLPTGLPERRLILRVEVVDDAGDPVGQAERAYGRHLVDAAGKLVPFYAAAKVENDNRLHPREKRTETFEFSPAGGGKLTVQLIWRSMPKEIAEQIGLDKIDEQVLAQATLPFGPPRPGKGRAKLPKRVEVAPPK